MFLNENYNSLLTNTKKNKKVKNSKSVDKIITKKKKSLSKMNEKLSLLNSDIEDLYKKYAEKKKIRRNKEKSEQYLVSRINFLIDEERKIRTQIENNSSKNRDNAQIKSVKIFTPTEEITNNGTIKYKTIESNDDNQLSGFNKFKKNKNNNKNINNSTISSGNSEQNRVMKNIINNSHNIKNIKRSNVTNNVCIIINNTEKNSLQNQNNNNYFPEEVSFSKNNKNININEQSSINTSTGEKDKRRMKIEIQNIKMKLASKIAENETISDNYYNLENSEINEDFMSTPSFNRKIKLGKNKNGIRSLKNILNMKRKYLKNLNKEIDLKRINLNTKKRSVETRKKKDEVFNINFNSENFDNKNTYKKTSRNKDLIIDNNSNNKKCYSKPILNTINKNKIQSSNKKSISLDNNISIDSNKQTKKDNYSKDKEKIINKNKDEIQKKKSGTENNNTNNINITNNSNKTVSLSNLTFNQSIEKKRKMLGIEINKINNDNTDINNFLKNIKYKIDNNNINIIKENKKNPLINNEEEIISNTEDINNNLNQFDVLSYPSISNVTNPIDNEINKNYANYIRNNFSLNSIFSNKSNKTSLPIKKIKMKKRYYDNTIDNDDDNNDAHFIKIKNILNNEIIIKKQEKNKNFVNSIRIIKKRTKNNIKEDNANNPINCDNTHKEKKEIKKDIKEKKQKIYNNEIINKELAVIRRINMKIEEYKNYKPKIQMISERRKNRFKEEKIIKEEDIHNKNIINNNNIIYDKNQNKKSNRKYSFKPKGRLSEIQKRTNNSVSKNDNLYTNKRARSISNTSMNKKLRNNNILPFRP